MGARGTDPVCKRRNKTRGGFGARGDQKVRGVDSEKKKKINKGDCLKKQRLPRTVPPLSWGKVEKTR